MKMVTCISLALPFTSICYLTAFSVQHLSPVIEAVSDASIAVPDSMMHVDLEER